MIRSIRYQFVEVRERSGVLEVHVHTVQFFFEGIVIVRARAYEEIILDEKSRYAN